MKDNNLQENESSRNSDAFTRRKSINQAEKLVLVDDKHVDLDAKLSQKKIVIASIICAIFFVIEMVAGIAAGSLALWSDAYHLLADLFSFILSWCAIWVSTLKGTGSLSFGYHRAEILGALFSILMIWGLTLHLIMEAVERLVNPTEVNGFLMFIVAAIGTIGNYIMTRVLCVHSHGFGSSDDCHNHDEDSKVQKLEDSRDLEENRLINPLLSTENKVARKNINVEAAYIHAYGDLIQNIGILVASACIWAKPDLLRLDPMCTIISALLVLCTTFTILRDTISILMEGTPREIDVHGLHERLLSLENVIEVHDLHVWSLSIGKPSLACHLVIDSESEARRILRLATKICQEEFGILHTTIQTDYSTNKLACDTNAHSRCH